MPKEEKKRFPPYMYTDYHASRTMTDHYVKLDTAYE